jgi:hypothetical protein
MAYPVIVHIVLRQLAVTWPACRVRGHFVAVIRRLFFRNIIIISYE